MKKLAVSALFFAIVFVALNARADGTGKIKGIVLDSRGNPAADVLVTAQQAAEKMRDPLQATTNEKGEFKFDKVPEGQYNLKIRTRDARSKAARTVTVNADKTADVGKITMKSN